MNDIPIKLIDPNPYQFRSYYDPVKLKSLVESIKKYGLKQIPTARKVGERYELAFGHQRFAAYKILQKKAGYSTMPLVVEELSDTQMFELFVIENMQREDLSPIDKANILQKYMDAFSATSTQAARLFGIRPSTVRGLTRLLDLPEDTQKEMRSGNFTQDEARRILARNARSGYYGNPKRKTKGKDDALSNNVRIKLIVLVFGKYVRDVSDEKLYHEIKKVFNIVRNIKE